MWRNRIGDGYRYRRLGYRPDMFWRQMRRLQQDMDFLLGGTSGPERTRFPAVNVWTGEEKVLVSVELPGVEPGDLDITVVGDSLTLKGIRKEETLPENARLHRRERATGQFSRTIELPFRVDSEAVLAEFDRGVLNIEMPRLKQDMPKKITVKSA